MPTFESDPKFLGPLEIGPQTEASIQKEPMFFGASVPFARQKGGEITRAFLDGLPSEFKERAIIDTRWHFLQGDSHLRGGEFPAIPGYHLDDIPRGESGQPNYSNPEYRSRHILTLLGANDKEGVERAVSRTRFIIDSALVLPEVRPGEVVYDVWNREIQQRIDSLGILHVPHRQLMEFGWGDFHEAAGAHVDGTRWFARASIDTNRPILDVIRPQVQSYIQAPVRHLINGEHDDASIKRMAAVNNGFSDRDIMTEPMLRSANSAFVAAHGGPIARAFMDGLPSEWKTNSNVVIDMGNFMLMPGWYPLIPGHPRWDIGNKLNASIPDTSIYSIFGNAGRIVHQAQNCKNIEGNEVFVVLNNYDEMANDGPISSALEPSQLFEINGGHLIVEPAERSGWISVIRARHRIGGEEPHRHFQSRIHLTDLYKGW